MSRIHNQKHFEECRKELRKNLTSAEATLWKYLQKKQLKEESLEDNIVFKIL